MKINKLLLLGAMATFVIAAVILELCVSKAAKVDSTEAPLFLAVARGVNGVYSHPDRESERKSFSTSKRMLAAFRDDERVSGTAGWYYVEEIGRTYDTALGFLPTDAVEAISPTTLKDTYRMNAGSPDPISVGNGGLFSTYFLLLRDLNCDGKEEIILRRELAQAPTSPRIAIYHFVDGRVRGLVDRQLVGDDFTRPIFLTWDLRRSCSQELVFFQPYGKEQREAGLTIYSWSGTKYEAVPIFTPLGVLLWFQCYSQLLAFLLLLVAIPFLIALLVCLLLRTRKCKSVSSTPSARE